jgi:multiple sugar transport system substrate-binding protein
MARSIVLLTLLSACLVLGGCGNPAQPVSPPPGSPDSEATPAAAAPAARMFEPIDPAAAVFWDRQVTETAELLRSFAEEFNRTHADMPVRPEYIGGYTEIFRKVTASIQAGTLPAMAASYESMTAEYVKAGAVAPLDGFVNDPKLGYSETELQDFFPVVLEINRYPQFGGKMYSFPFTKSVLMMYFNETVLREAGIQAPPQTWDEFLEQCRAIKSKTGKIPYALAVDASTIDGWIYSMGGEIVVGTETQFHTPPAIRVFELLETLAKEKLAYPITPGTYDDEIALSQGQVAFVFRSSSGRTHVMDLMEDTKQEWGMTLIPQADPDNPATVLYGPNVCIFNVTPEQQRTAWEFIKYFTSPDVAARWALGSGYVPIRKSAAEHPDVQRFWAEWKYNRAAYDCLPFARSEPNLAGWQRVRDLIDNAVTSVLAGLKSGRQAAVDLKQEADAALRRAAQ